jgi:hypothetical protein
MKPRLPVKFHMARLMFRIVIQARLSLEGHPPVIMVSDKPYTSRVGYAVVLMTPRRAMRGNHMNCRLRQTTGQNTLESGG